MFTIGAVGALALPVGDQAPGHAGVAACLPHKIAPVFVQLVIFLADAALILIGVAEAPFDVVGLNTHPVLGAGHLPLPTLNSCEQGVHRPAQQAHQWQ